MSLDAGLARPIISGSEAGKLAHSLFGVDGSVLELGSQQDRNFRIRSTNGDFVLKIANSAASFDEIDAQQAAMAALAGLGAEVPVAVAGLDGRSIQSAVVGGEAVLVRLLTFVAGTPLADVSPFTIDHARALGALSGAVASGLRTLEHPGLERITQWDARRGAEVVAALNEFVTDDSRRAAILAAVADACSLLEPLTARLTTQPIHGDLTDDNVVCATVDGTAVLSGVIDFGDVASGWLVAELATTCAAIIHRAHDPRVVLDVVSEFAAVSPLNAAEASALWPLVVLRTAVLVVSGEQQIAIDAGNEYADVRRAAEWRSFEIATALDLPEMQALVQQAANPRTAAVEGVPIVSGPIELLDFSVTSPALENGLWLEPDAEQRVAAAKSTPQVTRYGEYRLTKAKTDTAEQIATCALAIELYVADDTAIIAPVSGTVTIIDNAVVLDAGSYRIWLDGVNGVAGEVQAGDVLGHSSEIVRLQTSTLLEGRPPAFVRPGSAARWREICPDPSALFGVNLAVAEPQVANVLQKRRESFAHVQEIYYENPPEIERGWRHYLIDVYAQTYVDMVNNVATAGHAHPQIVKAAHDQWALLNTNSRFHYAALAEFSQRLAALAPEGLDTVFLVNSGSEAVDLALRLAQTHTGEPLIVATKEAYHGWTIGSDAVSSSLGDNPRALETRPEWVKLIETPHPIKGKYRGDDSAAGYLADFDADISSSTKLAGFIGEPVFGNAGGVVLPPGYLKGIYERVRARGGVCIADEVQVGYGRLGEYFWGTQQQGVVPDIITIAKAMGNGQPLGAVITTRVIADSFAKEGSFFSSAGGSPVSSRIGLAVLDIMQSEQLQANAATVGAHLKGRLEQLAARHPLIGAVYGLGLYLGVELVLDCETFEPATDACVQLCEALRHEGCIMQPTGDYKNVLKIKPPLVVTQRSVDHFVDALDRVLTRLEA
jgi:4-aminobutyrate aminotransferase-like enzyme/Ser/Thr protein kinase RdoA (MazF antagonist)